MSYNLKNNLVFMLIFLFSQSFGQSNYHRQWPQFRGPFGSGIMDSTDLPDNWNVEDGINIKWKTDIPGLGHSCPVIWGNQLFITTAISGKGQDSLKIGLYGNIDEVNDRSIHEFWVYCFDKNNGQVLWKHLAHKGVPKTERHTKSSHANPTPVTNGEYLVASFGSDGIYCYNLDGKIIWEKDLGKMNAGPYTDPDIEWGFASSPILHENKLIIQCDFVGDGFLASLDIETGDEIWKTPRDEISSWSTPNFYNNGKIKQVVVNGFKHMGAYDFETGREVWKMSGGGDAPVPIPVFAHDLIYIHNAHGRSSPIYAVKPEATGDITLDEDSTSNEFIEWSIKRGGAYMPTVVVYKGYLYNLRMNGYLSCFNAKTGENIYSTKIPGSGGGITASGVCSDDKLYYCTERGDVLIVKTGKEFELIAKNSMNDIIMATPAISENTLFFRTRHSLIAVEKDSSLHQ